MTTPCAHCSKWTCACGQPAIRENGGALGRDGRLTGPPDAYCLRCLQAVARVHGDGTVEGLGGLVRWLKEEAKI